jgi:hypothetical protein
MISARLQSKHVVSGNSWQQLYQKKKKLTKSTNENNKRTLVDLFWGCLAANKCTLVDLCWGYFAANKHPLLGLENKLNKTHPCAENKQAKNTPFEGCGAGQTTKPGAPLGGAGK